MRILMTTDTIGGVWTYSLDLIKALKPFNVEILLATLGDYPNMYQLNEINAIPYASLICSSFKLEWMEDPWNDIDDAKGWIAQIATDFNPDIIHLNNYSFDSSLFNAPVVMVGHSCVSSWWQAVKNEDIPSSWNRYSRMVKKGLQSADFVVAPSKTMLQYLNYYYGPFNNSIVIYNASDPFFYKPNEEKRKYIFSMGRIWDEAKNIRMLVDVARFIDYPIYIAGECKDSISLKDIPPSVFFIGNKNKEEIASWLSHASVYVLPVIYEPFGLSILEAAYSSCALVLGKIPSMIEIWNNDALYCDPRQPHELIEQVNEVMNNDALRQEYAYKALQRASKYKISSMAFAYHSLYSQMLTYYNANRLSQIKKYKIS